MKILYSFNKRGIEAEFWTREIAAASDATHQFVPFNHDPYVDVARYSRAQLLDNLYYARDAGLMAMYRDFEERLATHNPDAVIVDNAVPYHPDYLRGIPIYKVLRTGDGPMSAYDRDFAYVHAFNHVLYHSRAYSRDLSMPDKLRYLGNTRSDFWPFAVFDATHDPSQTEETIGARQRDIDVIFAGFAYRGKLPTFAKVKKALGRRVAMYGFSWKYNAYFNAKYGWPGWVHRPIRPGADFVELYQRAKIGFNVHNRGIYTVGNFRMFELPANGVMQISDGGEYLDDFYAVGREIEGYADADELIDKIKYFLAHDDERRAIALAGYRRTMRDHRMRKRLHQAAALIGRGMEEPARVS